MMAPTLCAAGVAHESLAQHLLDDQGRGHTKRERREGIDDFHNVLLKRSRCAGGSKTGGGRGSRTPNTR